MQNILSRELEGKEFIVEGRVVGLAQTGGAGAKFPFAIDDMLTRGETRCNKISPSNGTKLVYMLVNILKTYEATEIEKRLADLELAHMEVNK